MKLGFDIDGVIGDVVTPALAEVNKKFNLSLSFNDITRHDFKKIDFTGDEDLNKKVTAFMHLKFNDAAFLRDSVLLYKEAADAIRLFKKTGNSIHILTNRNKVFKEDTAIWLRKNNIPFSSLHVLGDGDFTSSKQAKVSAAKALNLDFFVDDWYRNLIDLLSAKKRWKKGLVLFDRPWNAHFKDESVIIRVKSWNEIIRLLGIHNR